MSLGQAVVDVTGNTEPLNRAITGLDGSLRRAILGSAVGNLIADGVGTIVGKVVDLGRRVGRLALGGGLSRVLDTENAVFMFTQMGLSMREVDDLMGQLRTTFGQSPFAYPDVFNVSSQLLASGSSLENVNDHMTNVGNAAALMQEDLNEVGNIFVKIAAEGRLTTVRLSQFETRGVNMAAILAEAMGVTEESFRGMVSAGEISSDMMHELMSQSQQLSAAMINAADTTTMQWSIFKTGIAGIGEALLAPWFGQEGTMVNFFKTINTQLFGSVIPSFERWGEVIHTHLSPVLDNVRENVDNMLDRLRPVGEWLSENRETIFRVAGTFAAVAGTIGTVTAALRFILPVLGALTGPVGIAVLAITGLALGFQHAWENSETFRSIVTGALERVQEVGQEALGRLADLFNDHLLPAFRNIGDTLNERVIPVFAEMGSVVSDRVLTVLSRLWEVLTETVIPTLVDWWEFLATHIIPIIVDVAKVIFDELVWAWDKLWEILDNVVIPTLERAYDFFRDNILPVLGTVAEFIRDEVIPRWASFRESLSEFADVVQERLLTPLRTAVDYIRENVLPILQEKGEVLREKVGEAVEALSELWREHLQPAMESIVDLWNDHLGPALQELWEKIDGPVMTVLKALGLLIGGAVFVSIMGFINVLVFLIETFTNVVNGIMTVIEWVGRVRNTITGAWTAIRSVNTGLLGSFNALLTGAQRVFSNLLSEARALPGRIRSAVGNLGSLLWSAGQDLIRGLIGGIQNMAGRAADAAKGVVNDAVNSAKNVLGIRSPSTVFIEIGKDTVKGLELGLAPTADLERAAMDLANMSFAGLRTEPVRIDTPTPRVAGVEVRPEAPRFDVRVYVGDKEIRDLVRVEVDEHDRNLDRRVTAGTGGFRL